MKILVVMFISLFVLIGCNGEEERLIHFETYQGSSMESVPMQSTLEDLDMPSRIGFTFEGWYFDQRLDEPFTQEGLAEKYEDETIKEITLYASWTPLYSFTSYGDGYIIRGFFDEPFETVHIPETINDRPVLAIAGYAFDNDSIINEVYIPEGVTVIGVGAFQGSSISSVIFEGTPALEEIKLNAFSDTKRLKEIEIPASVISIESNVFSGSSVETVTFAKNAQLKTLDGFQNMSYLKSIHIPASVEIISALVFSGAERLEQVTFEEGSQVQRIEEGAFRGPNRIRELEIPASVQYIGVYAFRESTRLHTVTFEEGSRLEEIMHGAFQGTRSLTEITIPANVMYIGKDAFRVSAFSTLEKVVFEENSQLVGIDNGAFAFSALKGELDIPDSVIFIGDEAFRQTMLSAINFGQNSQLKAIGEGAFYGSFIEQFELPEHVEFIGMSAFYNTYFLETLSFGNNVLIDVLGNEMFAYNGAIERLIVPDHIRTTDFLTFAHMAALMHIEFGADFEYLAPLTFKNSSQLETVIFHRTDGIVEMSLGEDSEESPFLGVSDHLIIYVPDALYDDYLADGVWSQFAQHIERLSNYQA